MKAEVRVTFPQARKPKMPANPQKPGERPGADRRLLPAPSPRRECRPASTSDFWPQTEGEQMSAVQVTGTVGCGMASPGTQLRFPFGAKLWRL